MNAFCFTGFLAVLLALGCSGAGEQTEAQSVGGASALPVSPTPTASATSGASGSGPSAGGGMTDSGPPSQAGGSTAGAAELGGSVGIEAGSPSSGGAPEAGAPSAGHGGSGGSAAGAGAAGSAPTCAPKSWEAACAGRSCGKADDGCGSLYACGSCAGLTECTSAGVCAATCHALALECGSHPAEGLECGSCPAGDECGVVGVGKCSTCEQSPSSGGICPSAFPNLWKPCGAPPSAECRRPYNQDPSWWCCP